MSVNFTRLITNRTILGDPIETIDTDFADDYPLTPNLIDSKFHKPQLLLTTASIDWQY